MAFHDRRPEAEEGVKPDDLKEEEESSEGEGTPTDPAEKNDPSVEEASEGALVEGETEGAEPVAVVPVDEEGVEVAAEPPEELKVPPESIESLTAKKAKLLKDVEDLRAERRGLKAGPFQAKEDPVFVKPPEEDPLKDIPPTDVDLIEKVLKAKGYVKKDEIAAKDYHGSVRTYTDAWLDKNPEFKPGSEEADEAWDKLNVYATKYFNKPADPKDVLEILDAARERLFGKKTPTLPSGNLHSNAAKKEKIAAGAKPSSGGSGGSKGNQPSENRSIDKSLLSHLQGFSEEELKEIAAS